MADMADMAELAVDAKAGLAESPWWDPSADELVFVDTVGRTVHRWNPRTLVLTSTSVGELVGAAVRRARGGMVLALVDAVAALDRDGHVAPLCPIEPDNTLTRLNDAKCDPSGRLFVGSLSGADHPGAGGLFRVDEDHRVDKVLSGTTMSNGIDWSPDGTTMYFIDSLANTVDAFDYDLNTGEMTRRRTLIEFGPDDGHPDGMTVDEGGYLWVASFGGGFVRRYTPSGATDGTLRVPASNVTNCAFGGPDLGTLYITTAGIELTDEQRAEQPHAGGVFRARPGIRGRLDDAFAG